MVFHWLVSLQIVLETKKFNLYSSIYKRDEVIFWSYYWPTYKKIIFDLIYENKEQNCFYDNITWLASFYFCFNVIQVF